MKQFAFVIFFLAVFLPCAAQEQSARAARGSIPEELIRPSRGEEPRYPVDMVIGEMGRGNASAEAYSFANSIAAAFLSGDAGNPGLNTVSMDMRENYLSVLSLIEPESYRLGGGRQGPDGDVSFLIRFIGRDHGITGELYIRYITREYDDETVQTGVAAGRWVFEDLILEEAKTRNVEQSESIQRYEFSPYERLF